jgi:hypothetical protein
LGRVFPAPWYSVRKRRRHASVTQWRGFPLILSEIVRKHRHFHRGRPRASS